MHTRPATLATLTIAVLTAACSAASSTTSVPSSDTAEAGLGSLPPVMHAAAHDFSTPAPGGTEVVHGDRGTPIDTDAATDPIHVDDPAAAEDPVDAAAGLLIDLLAAEGLLVTSIDTHLERADGEMAQVRVDVAHSPGHGHPVQSRYLLELARDAGRWRLAGFTEPD